MTIQELINNQMEHFISKLIAKNQLSHEKVIEVSANIGAYLIRTRHIQNEGISNHEIDMVLQSVVQFLHHNFKNQFTQSEIISIKDSTLNLLKRPNFDTEIQEYFKGYYK